MAITFMLTARRPTMSEFERIECSRDGCPETFFTQLAVDIHIVQDHGLKVEVDES